MKKVIFIAFALLMQLSFSQTVLKTDYVCTYDLEYSQNGHAGHEQFIMFIDAKDKKSFFESTNNFVKDTIDIKDPLQLASYDSDFNEKILAIQGHFKTFETVKEVRLKADESQNLHWEILKETKKVGNVPMQFAKTKAYGRTWFAWFSSDIPISFGPYKFNGLPGIITTLYDSDKKFTFTLQHFKKKTRTINLPDEKNYKLIKSADLNSVRYKILSSDDGSVIFSSAAERDNWMKGLQRSAQNVPLLDIEFPPKIPEK